VGGLGSRRHYPKLIHLISYTTHSAAGGAVAKSWQGAQLSTCASAAAPLALRPKYRLGGLMPLALAACFALCDRSIALGGWYILLWRRALHSATGVSPRGLMLLALAGTPPALRPKYHKKGASVKAVRPLVSFSPCIRQERINLKSLGG
jgi:hypothetical protein